MAERTARMVYVAANHGPYRANCLKRSLVIWGLLRRRGIPAELRIGVNNGEKIFQAHAWVESMGVVLAEPAGVNPAFQSSCFGL